MVFLFDREDSCPRSCLRPATLPARAFVLHPPRTVMPTTDCTYRWAGKKVLASKLFGHYTKNVGISAAAAGRGAGEEVSVSVARTVFLKTNDEPDQTSPPKQMIRCSKWRLPVQVCDGRSCGRNN